MSTPSRASGSADAQSDIASRTVRSASTPGLTYLVEVNTETGFGMCACAGYAFRGRCRHIDEMRRDLGVEAPPSHRD